MTELIAAHLQAFTHRYVMAYPEHGPRESDPHYADFHAYKKRRKAENKYYCDFAMEFRAGKFDECDLTKPLECHHKHIEFALLNGIDLSLLEDDYPGVSAMGIGAWVESAVNLELLCVVHHRTYAGKHTVSQSDFEGLKYFRDLTRKAAAR